jgi:hypothetical protein
VTALLARVDEETAHAERLLAIVGDGRMKNALEKHLHELDAIEKLLREGAETTAVAAIELAMIDVARRRQEVDHLVSQHGPEAGVHLLSAAHLAFSTLTGA